MNKTMEKIKKNGYDISVISKLLGYDDEKPLILAIGKYDKGSLSESSRLYYVIYDMCTGNLNVDGLRNHVKPWDYTSPKYPEITSKDDECSKIPYTWVENRTQPLDQLLKEHSHVVDDDIKERYACSRCLLPIGFNGKEIIAKDHLVIHLCNLCYSEFYTWLKSGRS